MIAHLINPKLRTITPIAIFESGDMHLMDIYRAVECDYFTSHTLNIEGDAIFVDSEALLKDLTKQSYFRVTAPTGSQLLAGNGLVLGIDFEGRSVAHSLTLEQLSSMIEWVDNEKALPEAESLLSEAKTIYFI